MVFVDTGAWFAWHCQSDLNHNAAANWVTATDERLVTTDWVIGELLTLCRARRQRNLASYFADEMMRGELTEVVQLTHDDFESALEVYTSFADKDWSFVDCTSYVAIQRLGVQRAFAFDHHFRQFGTVEVVPK